LYYPSPSLLPPSNSLHSLNPSVYSQLIDHHIPGITVLKFGCLGLSSVQISVLHADVLLRSWTSPFIFTIFHPFILHSQSPVLYLFPYALLGPSPNHLTSHLMDHLTIPQSDITCHHSAVCSIPQHHHLFFYGLPAHCHIMMRPPAHDGAILRTASS